MLRANDRRSKCFVLGLALKSENRLAGLNVFVSLLGQENTIVRGLSIRTIGIIVEIAREMPRAPISSLSSAFLPSFVTVISREINRYPVDHQLYTALLDTIVGTETVRSSAELIPRSKTTVSFAPSLQRVYP